MYISILGKGAEKKAAPKKEQPKKETPKKVEKEEEPPAPKEKKDPYADFPKPWVLQYVIYSDLWTFRSRNGSLSVHTFDLLCKIDELVI